MCQKIVINRGVEEIESPQELEDHFLTSLSDYGPSDGIDHEACLCQIDIDAFLKDQCVAYKISDGDYFIGQLDKINSFEVHYIPKERTLYGVWQGCKYTGGGTHHVVYSSIEKARKAAIRFVEKENGERSEDYQFKEIEENKWISSSQAIEIQEFKLVE